MLDELDALGLKQRLGARTVTAIFAGIDGNICHADLRAQTVVAPFCHDCHIVSANAIAKVKTLTSSAPAFFKARVAAETVAPVV